MNFTLKIFQQSCEGSKEAVTNIKGRSEFQAKGVSVFGVEEHF